MINSELQLEHKQTAGDALDLCLCIGALLSYIPTTGRDQATELGLFTISAFSVERSIAADRAYLKL